MLTPSRESALAYCKTLYALAFLTAAQAWAEPTITSVAPRAVVPGRATELVLHGKDLRPPLRVWSRPGVSTRVLRVEETKAVLEVNLKSSAALGPLELWAATTEGPSRIFPLLADDLPGVEDNGENHSRLTAQPIEAHCFVSGTSNVGKSDFYSFSATAKQRVAIEVHTQPLGSSMDPLIRLLTSDGRLLHESDDDEVGPESRFSYTFQEAGDYLLEVRDSRYGGDQAYHLRVGDFPLVLHCDPLAIQSGKVASVGFACLDEQLATTASVETTSPESVVVTARGAEGNASAWARLLVRDFAIQREETCESTSAPGSDPLRAPIGVSGRLRQPRETDHYRISGSKGEKLRIASRTRSCGSPTLLKMALFDAANSLIAKSEITESDEWSLNATLPADGEFRLEVTDLLGRGGARFGYFFEVVPQSGFIVEMKADAKARQAFALEPRVGACAVDLQISRHGYDGPINLSVAPPDAGITLVNPTIPAEAKKAKIYLQADPAWSSDKIKAVRLLASAPSQLAAPQIVSSLAQSRVKDPHILYPDMSRDGELRFAGTEVSDAFFSLAPTTPFEFATTAKSHVAALALKRVDSEFKGAVTLLAPDLAGQWDLSVVNKKDVYTATLKQRAEASVLERLSLLAFAEFKGRGRLESVDLPVSWIKPLQVTLDRPAPVIAGQSVTIPIRLQREGKSPQPVKIRVTNLPAGLGVADPIEIAADQETAELHITPSANLKSSRDFEVAVQATTRFADQEIEFTSNSIQLHVIAKPTRLEVYPAAIELTARRARQRFVATGFAPSGAARDWTREVRARIADPRVAEIRDGVIYPLTNGTSELVVEYEGCRQQVPLTVTEHGTMREVEFENEVLVALSKQGCNSGACHGSPSGKGGFRLSLRAFDKQLDQLTLIREEHGRRVNPFDAEQSLLLLKPQMRVSHGGGKQLRQSDPAYEILRDWIVQGAQADPEDRPRCVRLEVYPSGKQLLRRAGGGQQLAITAHFFDGTSRDVTHLAAYESSNSRIATVDESGFVQPQSRGEAVVLVRFLEHIESLPLLFVEDVPGFVWEERPSNNYIDDLVHAKLKQLQYSPAPTCSDTEFLRRVYLDVIGILPSVQECREFLDDKRSDKRARLINSLLERPEHAKFWALKWADLLRVTGKQVGDSGVYKYYRWLETAIRDNMPYDEFARQLLTSAGSTLANPPANFYRTASDMNDCVETISQLFLGARLQCAKCHNHPFERWTQDNYYGLGAFFNRIERRKTQRPEEMFVYSSSEGEVTQPRTGEVMRPWLPRVGSQTAPEDGDRRFLFAEWLIDAKNPFFAKIEANRIWSQLFARGIVEPIDDFRDSNPPSNDALLEALAQDFATSGFDRKHLVRVILNSRTYQASYQTNEFNRDDSEYFSHQEPRLLGAERLLDAINHLMGLAQSFGNLPAGTRATQIPAPDVAKVEFLKVFGQPQRSTVCACERAEDSNLAMAIELFNGPLIHEKLGDPQNRFRRAMAAGRTVDETIQELYLAAVCRHPTATELTAARKHCENSTDLAIGLEDVCWALINTDEFLFQH